MKTDSVEETNASNEEIPARKGDFRMTRQRRVVYEVLMDKRDHPTASEVFDRAKRQMPSISLATVYNCLETMSQAGLVRQVNVNRDASRFCPNLQPHAHFFCTECEAILDVDPRTEGQETSAWRLPEGSLVSQVDVAMRGLCSDCREKQEVISSRPA